MSTEPQREDSGLHATPDQSRALAHYLPNIRRRMPLLLAVAFLVSAVGVTVALILPPVYRSSATILIERPVVSDKFVNADVPSFASQRIELIRRRVMTSANLLNIAERYDLYAPRDSRSPAQLIDSMEKDISVELISVDADKPHARGSETTIAFSLAYESFSPALAMAVVDELARLFLSENVRSRNRSASETWMFLRDEAERLGKRVTELENKLARFKERSFGMLPEQVDLNRQLLDRIERDLASLEQNQRALRERKVYLESELGQLKRYIDTDDPAVNELMSRYSSMLATYGRTDPATLQLRQQIEASVARGTDAGSWSTRRVEMALLRAEIEAAQSRYSSEHPTVKRLRRRLEAVTAEVAEGAAVSGSAARRVRNPAHVQLAAQLKSTRLELQALRAKEDSLRERRRVIEEQLIKAPEVEREYRLLTRDYENALEKYRDLRTREQEARLAEVLESESKAERFTLVEPPRLPENPIKPNRAGIASFSLLAGLVSGLVVALLADALDTTLRTPADIMRVFGHPPLASIPYRRTPWERRRRRVLSRTVLAVLLTVLLVVTMTDLGPTLDLAALVGWFESIAARVPRPW